MGKRVLVVESNARGRKLLLAALRAVGLEAWAVSGPKAAMTSVLLQPPDLVLLDMDMPRGGSLHALRGIARDHPRVPIIMISEDYDESQAREAVRLGAIGVLAKPLDIEKFGKFITLLIGERRSRKP
jgi:DNA-binding NtrC family response regulator